MKLSIWSAGSALAQGIARFDEPSELIPWVLTCSPHSPVVWLDIVPYLFFGACMDWDFAIERHREPLLRIVVGLFAMIGLTEGGAVERLSRPLYRLVLGILRPAESAVRRLIIVAARDIVVEPRLSVRFRKGASSPAKANTNVARPLNCSIRPRISMAASAVAAGTQVPNPNPAFISSITIPGFPCSSVRSPRSQRPFPKRMRQSKTTPSMPDLSAAVSPPSSARWKICRARRSASRAGGRRPIEERRPKLTTPLRVGRPPGFRQRQTHEVDEILAECHWLARNVPSLDTS